MRAAVRTVADAVGRGLLAGAAGTAAMTLSSTLEAKLSGRGSSSTPAEAVSEATGVELTDESKPRVNRLAHWGYGVGWGAVRGVLGLLPASEPLPTIGHFAVVWGAEQVLLPALGVAKPTWSYGASAAATDVLHHVVYAGTTSAALAWIEA
jgi:hypothetical protein